MLWLTWRQHRWQLVGVTIMVAIYWGFLLQAGVRFRRGISDCPRLGFDPSNLDACNRAMDLFNAFNNQLNQVVYLGNLLPLAVGMFWGAPLIARELEQGTYRLTFLQSVSRRRWLAVKLGALAGVAAGLGAVTGAVVSWSQTVPLVDGPFGNVTTFSQSGLVPIATWVFSLLAGTALGALLRRTLTAVAVTLVVLPLAFGGLVLLRPHYLPPVEQVAGGAQMFNDPSPATGPRGWLYELSYLDPDGRELDSETAGTICADPANTYPTAGCLDRTGMRQVAVYQPADRYLWFQLTETGLLLAAAVALVPVVRHRVRRPLP